MECVLPRVIEIGSAGNAFWNTPRNISVKHSPCPQVVEQVRRADTRARTHADDPRQTHHEDGHEGSGRRRHPIPRALGNQHLRHKGLSAQYEEMTGKGRKRLSGLTL